MSLNTEKICQKSAEDFFDQVIEENQDEDPCKELLKVLAVINTACSKFLHFAAIIREVSRIDYSQLTLSTFDKMVMIFCSSVFLINVYSVKRVPSIGDDE